MWHYYFIVKESKIKSLVNIPMLVFQMLNGMLRKEEINFHMNIYGGNILGGQFSDNCCEFVAAPRSDLTFPEVVNWNFFQ